MGWANKIIRKKHRCRYITNLSEHKRPLRKRKILDTKQHIPHRRNLCPLSSPPRANPPLLKRKRKTLQICNRPISKKFKTPTLHLGSLWFNSGKYNSKYLHISLARSRQRQPSPITKIRKNLKPIVHCNCNCHCNFVTSSPCHPITSSLSMIPLCVLCIRRGGEGYGVAGGWVK